LTFFPQPADYELFAALTRAALCDTASAVDRTQHHEALAAHHRQLQEWAENCPDNFANRAALVGAEIARLEGRELEAERLYQQAIESAHANGFIQNEGLAYELAARFYAARGFEAFADVYVRNARHCYMRWGADGKVRQLDQQHPELRQEQPVASSKSVIAAPVEHLDLATVIKVSQAVSAEMVVEKLIEKLMRAAIEHAGAVRGLLIVPRGDELHTHAVATTSGEDVSVQLPDGAQTGAALPESLVRYVMRTQEIVILDDASSRNPFSADPYIVQHHARSILCLALISRGKLIGILYLENNLTPHVFSPDRVTVLKVLASQAAISLENAQLYCDVENREAQLRLITDTTPAMIFSCLPDGSPDFFNRRWLEYLDLPLEEISGWSWTSVVHPQDLEDLLNKWRSSLVTGEPLEVEARSRRGDGEYRRLLHRAVPLRDEHGIIVKWYVSSIDIEDRRQAEEAVRRSEAYLSEAQHLSHTGSFGCKPASREMFWSEETFRIFQYDRATKPAVDAILQRVHPEDKALVQERIDRAINESKDCDMEYRLLLPDNSIKHVHVVAHAVKDDPGEFDFVGAVMDVTEHRQATAQLQRAFEEIRALKDRLYQENIALRDEVDRTSMFEEIVGTSRALKAVLSRIAKVAPTDSTVLITGETGTGKELIARAVHKRSQRSGHAFVSVNCAALAPTLISSELFGHEKGAFTGAVQRRLGRFEMADGGTIFLDEVGELLPDTQAALLRVLQERAFERVGGGQPIDVDVRVIAATNRDLRAAVANGTFRQDLLYRLNVFPIEIPPLRERKDDILMLIEYFVQRYATRAGKHIRSIDKKTLDLLQSYDWPGNIRELQNVIERSVILSSSEIFFVDEFWFASEIPAPGRRVEAPKPSSHDRRTEREIIEAALTESRGRVSGPSGAAAKLRIPPSTLETRIKALKINKSQFKFR